jgi:hypothetical protein
MVILSSNILLGSNSTYSQITKLSYLLSSIILLETASDELFNNVSKLPHQTTFQLSSKVTFLSLVHHEFEFSTTSESLPSATQSSNVLSEIYVFNALNVSSQNIQSSQYFGNLSYLNTHGFHAISSPFVHHTFCCISFTFHSLKKSIISVLLSKLFSLTSDET